METTEEGLKLQPFTVDGKFFMNRFITFLKEARVELSKVSWPSRQQLITYSLTVIAISLFLSIFLGALDFGFVTILNKYVLQ